MCIMHALKRAAYKFLKFVVCATTTQAKRYMAGETAA